MDSGYVVVWCIAEWNSLLLSPCLSLWCPFVKRHRSPRTSITFYHVQKLIQGPIDMNTEENVVFADTLPKRRPSVAKFLKFDTSVNIVGCFTVECVCGCLPQNVGCLST